MENVVEKLFLLFLLSISIINVSAQTLINSNHTKKSSKLLNKNQGTFIIPFRLKTILLKIYDLDLLETENVIVEFTTPPMFKVK